MYVCAVSIAKDFMKNNEQELLIYQKKIKILSLGFRLFYKYYSVVNEFASEAYLEPRDICIYLADSCRPATALHSRSPGWSQPTYTLQAGL